MEDIIIYDTDIVAVNRGKKENESSNILYRDKGGKWHSIDIQTCADNFSAEHGNASHTCIGERNIQECYFLFYTSGLKTKVVFAKKMVRNHWFRYHLLSGSNVSRFLALEKMIGQTRFTTYDLS